MTLNVIQALLRLLNDNFDINISLNDMQRFSLVFLKLCRNL